MVLESFLNLKVSLTAKHTFSATGETLCPFSEMNYLVIPEYTCSDLRAQHTAFSQAISLNEL